MPSNIFFYFRGIFYGMITVLWLFITLIVPGYCLGVVFISRSVFLLLWCSRNASFKLNKNIVQMYQEVSNVVLFFLELNSPIRSQRTLLWNLNKETIFIYFSTLVFLKRSYFCIIVSFCMVLLKHDMNILILFWAT